MKKTEPELILYQISAIVNKKSIRRTKYFKVTEIRTYSVEAKTDEEAVEKVRKTIESYDDGENIIEKCLKKGTLKVEIEKE